MAEQTREQALEKALLDMHYMARRYADMRQTFAAQTVNKHTRALFALGVPLKADHGTLWARDGAGRAYDGLSDDEARSAALAAGEVGPPSTTAVLQQLAQEEAQG